MSGADRDRAPSRPSVASGGGGRLDLDPRDVRALTEYLTVLGDIGRARGADDLYLVVSQSGREYLVDGRTGACECSDHRYRGVRCKHARRVEFATGERAVPAGVDGVDERLGEHVDGTPRVAVTDGGKALEVDDAGDGEPREDDPGRADRPAECSCWDPDGKLPCWPCYRDGFEEPNPEAPAAAE